MSSTAFWEALDALVSACELVIDRPGGTAHPPILFKYGERVDKDWSRPDQ